MIELAPRQLPPLTRWFPAGTPGPATIVEHALTTGVGHWWADQADRPRVIAVSCADHVVLRGTPDALGFDDLASLPSLAPLANTRIETPARFLPALGSAFDRLTPWERMVWTLQADPQPCAVPRGVTVRRLEPADTDALLALGPDTAWIHASWGDPLGLAASGHGWAAMDRKGQVLAIACTYFRGTRYEDVAVFTDPGHRRHRLALACVTALAADIAARGHIPSWNCSVQNRAGRLLAWNAGFRLVREYVHYGVGSPVARDRLSA
ncbi:MULTISPECIES: GNAT family N-acetyltransferase [unclassified Streptomyces]|uniref:GNAT family N-acetyltransferase n=1 Tax=unclassified Streptomyces TaxID=2593676 RepID=UPI0036528C17